MFSERNSEAMNAPDNSAFGNVKRDDYDSWVGEGALVRWGGRLRHAGDGFVMIVTKLRATSSRTGTPRDWELVEGSRGSVSRPRCPETHSQIPEVKMALPPTGVRSEGRVSRTQRRAKARFGALSSSSPRLARNPPTRRFQQGKPSRREQKDRKLRQRPSGRSRRMVDCDGTCLPCGVR